ncbi:MAG: GxxExxY protein [Pyrinomonadaceae bacterium]|nr:GxxExxY protein [Pyrinomonadaceae bacterium]
MELEYKGTKLEQFFIPDFVCFGCIVIELKAMSKLVDEHRSQVLNYLHALNFRLGLLINFGHHPKVEYERIVT